MAFDPDAYLKSPAKPAFDPDAYLKASPAPAAPASKPPEEAKPPGMKGIMDLVFGGPEAAANLVTSAIAKPVSDVAGLAAMGRDVLRDKPEGNAGEFKDYVQRAMTYQPRTATGQAVSQYNPLALMGRGVNAVGGAAEQIIAPPGASTGRQMVGAGVHEAMNQAPGFMGAKVPAAARYAEGALKTGARDMMQSALKPDIASQRTGKAATAIDTLLDTRTNVSKAGVDKLQNRITDLNQQISDKIVGSKAVVDKQVVADNLKTLMDDFKKQVNPNSDMHTVQAAYDEFLNHPSLSGKAGIPVQLAQEMKQATYKSVGGKAYGEMKSADLEAQKALARGLKEEIAKSVPEVRKLNTEDSKLLATLPLVERRVLMDANKNPIGLGWMTLNPAKFAGWMADRSPGFKSVVAHMLNTGSETAGRIGRIGRITPPGEMGPPPIGLSPKGERIPSLPRDQGRPMAPPAMDLAQMMSSSPGAGIPKTPIETVPGHGLYPDIHEAQRAALEKQLSQGPAYRHEPFNPSDQLGALGDNWSTSRGAGIPKPPHGHIGAESLYDKHRPVRPDPQVLQMLGIDFHPTPIVDAEGFVARTAKEQEALRDPAVKASKEAQKKAAEERAAKAKKKKDDDK